jgi:hypothetical protein
MYEQDQKISEIRRFSGENTYSPPFLLPGMRGIGVYRVFAFIDPNVSYEVSVSGFSRYRSALAG